MSTEDNSGLSPCPYCGTVPRTKPHYFEELWNVECGNDACPWPDEHDPWATGYLAKDAKGCNIAREAGVKPKLRLAVI